MRGLTSRQKVELKKWFDKNYDGGYKFDMADKIDSETYNRIEEMHPTEIHYQNVNHFLEECVESR
jgi:hypothetical protein